MLRSPQSLPRQPSDLSPALRRVHGRDTGRVCATTDVNGLIVNATCRRKPAPSPEVGHKV